MIQQIYFAT